MSTDNFGIGPWWLKERYASWSGCELTIERFVAKMKDKKLDRARVGFESKWMPQAIYAILTDELPEVEFVPADRLVPQMRFIKRPRERQLLKTAVEIGFRSMEDYMQALRDGASRREALLIRAKRALELGGEWIGGSSPIMWTGGTNDMLAWWDAPARRYYEAHPEYKNWLRWPDDCPVHETHLGTRFQGYWSDLAWHEFFGPQPGHNELIDLGDKKVRFSELAKDYEMLRQVQKQAIQEIKPGMDHFQARKVLNDYREKNDPSLRYYVHSLGLEIHEEPCVRSRGPGEDLYAGPFYYHPGAVVSSEWFSRYWTIEDPFVLTEQDGWQPLADLKGIVQLH